MELPKYILSHLTNSYCCWGQHNQINCAIWLRKNCVVSNKKHHLSILKTLMYIHVHVQGVLYPLIHVQGVLYPLIHVQYRVSWVRIPPEASLIFIFPLPQVSFFLFFFFSFFLSFYISDNIMYMYMYMYIHV